MDMRLPLLLPLFGLLALGCAKDPVSAVVKFPTQKLAWMGTYTSASGQGDVVVDLAKSGTVLTGEVVFGSPATHFWVSGTMSSDSMFLGLDPFVYPPILGDFLLRARVLNDGSLSGTITHVPAGLSAQFSCRSLTRRSIDTDASRDVPYGVFAMAYDGSNLWLATTVDYVRMNPGGAIVDTIVIYHDPLPAHWVSSELMYDGALMWGVYPITIIGPGGTTDVADLLAFTASGRAPDSLRLAHRPHGLAHDGAHSWSLRGDPTALLRFDSSGAVTDSLHLGIPDATDLAFDGTHFWVVGWFLRRMYEVDLSGQVVSFCDLPRSPGSLPAGLAIEGSYIWYAEGDPVGATTLHRMTIR